MLCASVAVLDAKSEASFTPRDYANISSAAQRLRSAGYQSAMVFLELIPIAGIRPSSDLDLLPALYTASGGCITPGMIFSDMAGSIKESGKGTLTMFRGFSHDGFANYVKMVGRMNSCVLK